MSKEQLRRILKQQRAAISPKLRQQKSVEIASKLCHELWWRNTHTVHIYCSFGTEVMTDIIRIEALRSQKRVIVPIAEADNPILRHAEIFPETSFTADAWGIPLPTPERSILCNPRQIMAVEDCIIIPLLGFDANLNRLGYGRGYYDRFLGAFAEDAASKPLFAGLAFAEAQYIAEGLPTETTDIPLDIIITEQGIIRNSQAFGV